MIFKCPTVEFEIINQVAKGGMGTIYKAIQKGAEGFEKIVAIKMLNPELAKDPGFRDSQGRGYDRFEWRASNGKNPIHVSRAGKRG